MSVQENYSFSKFSKLFNSYISVIDKEIKSFSKLFQEIKDKNLLSEYLKNLDNDGGFNIFTLLSDGYYKENYNSNILKAFLEIKENKELVYLNVFIDFLNRHFQAKLDRNDFDSKTIIEREKDYIDILIKNENSKKAIIIESKINNASDQPRQIPGYKKKLEERGYKVVSIIYLVLDINKKPDKTDWTVKEIKQIDPILKIIPAYKNDKKNKDLYSWLKACQNKNNNEDVLSTLKEYTKLIKHLGDKEMNEVVKEKFLEEIKGKGITFKELVGFREMLNDFSKTVLKRIVNYYENNEDIKRAENIRRADEVDLYLKKYTYKNEDISIVIHIDIPQPNCWVSVALNDDYGSPKAKKGLEFLEGLMGWDSKDGGYSKWFNDIDKSTEDFTKSIYNFIDNKLIPKLKKSLPASK